MDTLGLRHVRYLEIQGKSCLSTLAIAAVAKQVLVFPRP